MNARLLVRLLVCLVVLGLGAYNYANGFSGGGALLVVGGVITVSTVAQLLRRRGPR